MRFVWSSGTGGPRSASEAAIASTGIEKPGTVTIAGKPGDDLPRGTWASVVKQAGLKE